MTEFTIKQNDTAPELRVTPLDEDRLPVPLTSAGSATFKMKVPDGPIKVDDQAATIDTGVDPHQLVYTWQAGDTDQDGVFDGEFTITWLDGTVTTFPNFRYIRIKIKEELA